MDMRAFGISEIHLIQRKAFSLIAGILVITVALTLSFTLGGYNILYVITSGSMSPTIDQNDLILVNRLASLETLQVGDIIVFNSPDGVSGVVTHRVVQFLQSESGPYVVTKGDANRYSIPQIDYPITSKDLIGTVALTIPSGGDIVSMLRPPTAHIIIIGLIVSLGGGTVVLQTKKAKEKTES
jgi:signal peptidase I